MTGKLFLAEKRLRIEKRALDDDTEEMIQHANSMGIDTVFSRQAKYDESTFGIDKTRCNFGSLGICYRQCAMGPCRIWNEDILFIYKLSTPRLEKGTCGASVDTIIARNLLMMVARGTTSHASHARHVASSLLKTAQKKTPYWIKEPEKLRSIASKLKIDTENDIAALATEAASIALSGITQSHAGNGMPGIFFYQISFNLYCHEKTFRVQFCTNGRNTLS